MNGAQSRFAQLRGEFLRLHAEQGDYSGSDSIVHALKTRGASVELPAEDKLDLVGFMNLSRASSTATRYAGSLPMSRLGQTPSVVVTASPNWITGGSHMPCANPAFKAFCEQRKHQQYHHESTQETRADEREM